MIPQIVMSTDNVLLKNRKNLTYVYVLPPFLEKLDRIVMYRHF